MCRLFFFKKGLIDSFLYETVPVGMEYSAWNTQGMIYVLYCASVSVLYLTFFMFTYRVQSKF